MDISSKTDICNLALDLLSAGTVLNVEDPSTATEELLSRWYDQCRRKVLREHPWNFATKRATLAADSDDPAFGYTAQYSVPADFLRLLCVMGNSNAEYDIPAPTECYQLEGGKIMTNGDLSDTSGALNIKYIYDIKSVSSFDPMFIDLLAHEIAVSVAYKVTESNTNVQRIDDLHKRRAAMAKAIDGQERPPTRVERSRAKWARRSLGNGRTDRIIF